MSGRRWKAHYWLYLAFVLLVIALIFGEIAASHGNASAAPRGPTQAPVQLQVPAKVQVTLQALDVLHRYGYSIDTPARAARAIRHWQRANGLTVDGIVGPQTLASLNVSATAASPAVRVSPPVPVPPVATLSDVESIIRDVWPDELEDHALAIVARETGGTFDPTVRNACCWGLFQIYFGAHRAMLADLGVTDAHQLLDARTNATVALALYQLDGWHPWDCHGQCQDVP